MSLKRKCHQNANVTKMQMCQNTKFVSQMSPKHKCHQNVNVTKTQISPLELTFVYLPNGSGKNRSPDLITINPNGLPGHGLCYSRLVLHSILSRTILTVIYVGPQNCFIGTTDSFIKNHTLAWTKTPKLWVGVSISFNKLWIFRTAFCWYRHSICH